MLLIGGEIGGQRFAEAVVGEMDGLQFGGEGGVAAMIRPVGIQNADFRFRRLALQGGEMLLHEGEIGKRHGQTLRAMEGGESVGIKRGEAVMTRSGRGFAVRGQGGVGEIFFTRFDGVDQPVAQAGAGVIVQIAAKAVGDGAGDARIAKAGVQETQALFGGIGALVKLAGQGFDDEGEIACRQGT